MSRGISLKKTFWIIGLVLLCSVSSFAQQGGDAEAPYSWALGLQTGPYLPNQIPNVTEIQPTTILRFSFPSNATKATEYMLSASNAEGVTIYNLSISSKTEMVIEGGLNSLLYIGLDATSFKTQYNGSFNTKGGVHLGIGLLMPMGGDTNFRMDMKFNFSNPGTALQLGFGFEIRYPQGDAAAEGN